MEVLLSPQCLLCRKVCMDSKKTNVFKILNIRNIQMFSTEILRVRNHIYITLILYCHFRVNAQI